MLDGEYYCRGPAEVVSQQNDSQGGGNRKIDQIVLELRRYNMSMGALQDTKWFVG